MHTSHYQSYTQSTQNTACEKQPAIHSRAHRDDSRRDFPQEVSVVGDGDNGALKLHQSFFQHLLGGYVQVVGGLVKHQEGALCQHELGQR